MTTSTADRVAWAPRTAFVLAGGAALGAMQAGMVHALYERGIAPDLLIGTSAGALNAAFLASRPITVATAEELAAVWRGLRRSDILPLRPATLVSGLAGRRDHLIPDQALRRLAARHLQFERLDQAAIPLHLVAFDLLAGTEVRLSDGPLADAVLAAAAIPGVLPPVRWRGRLLADGGIADNTPVSHAVALGARRIYVLPTQNPGDRGLPRPPRAALAAAVHAVTVLTNARLHGDLARYAPSAELIVLPAANPGHIPPTDFGHAGQLITRALAAARTALATGTPNPPGPAVTLAGLWLTGPDVETGSQDCDPGPVQQPALVQEPPASRSSGCRGIALAGRRTREGQSQASFTPIPRDQPVRLALARLIREFARAPGTRPATLPPQAVPGSAFREFGTVTGPESRGQVGESPGSGEDRSPAWSQDCKGDLGVKR
jgi:NTE family protein